MKRIGITGPTGAGKTTVLNALVSLGGAIIDCDEVYHELLEGSGELRRELTDRFGTGILDGNGQVARKCLGRVVFGDPAALEQLNSITGRFILAAVEDRCRQAEAEGRPAVGIDAIRLIESGISRACDTIVGVLAPSELRIRRIMAREGIPEDYARQRVAAQQDDEFYATRCAYVLHNDQDGRPELIRAQAEDLFRSIIDND